MPKRPWWRRRRVWLLAAVLACGAFAPFAIPAYQSWQLDRDLAAVLAETDTTDPGWRVEEMRAKRAPVPDAENAYPVFVGLGKLLPKSGYDPDFKDLELPEGMESGSAEHREWISQIRYSLEDAPDVNQLNTQQIAALASEWKHRRQMFEIVRQLREFQRCRFPSDTLDQQAESNRLYRNAASLLSFEVLRHCQDEKMDEALLVQESLLALCHLQHEEVDFGSPFVHCATLHIMCDSMKRVLAQGECKSDRLEVLQNAMMHQAKHARLLHHSRVFRADLHKTINAIMNSSRDEQADFMKLMNKRLPDNDDRQDNLWWLTWLFQKTTAGDPRRWALEAQRGAIQWIEFAKRSEEQFDMIDSLPSNETVFFTPFPKIHEMNVRTDMHLRTTYTAIALERYRQANGAWPKSLELLVPAFLPQVPNDVYTSKPLQYRLLDRGVIVYSVGKDKTDNGGKLRPDQETAGLIGLDIGVRLWDPAHRRQQPLPPVLPRSRQNDL